MKELLKLKGNTTGFHPQTQKLELYNTSINTVPYEGTPKEAIHLNGNNMDRLNSGKTSRHNMVYECIYFDYFGPDATLDFHVEDQPY